MNDLSWYATNAAMLALFIESLKRTVLHRLRDRVPLIDQYYSGIVMALAVAVGVAVCFVVKADALVPLEIYGFHPYAGYIVGGLFLAGGNSIIDDVWDNRKLIQAFLESLKKDNTNAPV